jgi:hypothetical protein
VSDCGATLGSDRYPGTAWPLSVPEVYWPRTTSRVTALPVNGRTAWSTFSRSLRTASARNDPGGSIVVTASN